MKILPAFTLGIGNGWIPLGLYFLALILSIMPYSQEARIWLFQNPVNRGQKMLLFIRRVGRRRGGMAFHRIGSYGGSHLPHSNFGRGSIVPPKVWGRLSILHETDTKILSALL
jgi:hypothetical protein